MTTVALLVFEGCDLLDVGGPYEVLLTAQRLVERRGEPAPFDVRIVAPADAPVQAYGGLGLAPTGRLADPVDVAVIPGLIDVDRGLADPDLLATVRDLTGRAEVTASVCTGAFLLAAVGLLADRAATTHHEDAPLLAARDDVGAVLEDVRWVDTGTVVTGAGLSSGLALGLHLVARLAGADLAAETAAQIEHPWSPDDGVTVPAP